MGAPASDALGVNAIAQSAGVSRVLIYRYCGDYPAPLRAAADRLKRLGACGRLEPLRERCVGLHSRVELVAAEMPSLTGTSARGYQSWNRSSPSSLVPVSACSVREAA